MTEAVEKRASGKITTIGDRTWWLVLSESVQEFGTGTWIHGCDEEVLGATVVHPIWYPEFGQGVGGGETLTRAVPYCPRCEDTPSEIGHPVYSPRPGIFD